MIAGYAQKVSSTRKDRQNRTHVDHSLTCCSEEISKVLGKQNVVEALFLEREIRHEKHTKHPYHVRGLNNVRSKC